MRSVFTLLLVLVGTQVGLSSVRVDGYCYLEGETDHSGTKVKFLEASPTADTDSTYTEASGYFGLDLMPGVYDIEYSQHGFLPLQMEDLALINDTALPSQTLPHGVPLFGALSGTLGPDFFIILGNVSVNSGDMLRLMPGTVFRFGGPYSFEIEGTLLAEGTESDSIVFTIAVPLNPDHWRNLHFSGSASSGSRLAYCDIQNGSHPSLGGGGIECSGSSPTITNCTIRNNTAHYGGGVGLGWSSSPTITHCTIIGNSANLGGGLYCGDNSSPTITHCTVVGNSADLGGGLYCGDNSSPALERCTITDNSAYCGDGVYCRFSLPSFSSTVITYSGGSGIYFFNSASSQFEYCDVFGSSGANFAFYDDDPSQGPSGIGELVSSNTNGDSCDGYYNIFLDPMFTNAAAGDYHLLAGSPCIDAGDPNLPLDPDNTVADIGAFYFSQLDVDEPVAVLPRTYTLHPNWPNPFNPITNIRYDVPQTGHVGLVIHNLLGQEVIRLVDKGHLPGSYTVAWNAAHWPSGLYLCRMEAEGFTQVRKLVLVK